MWTFTTLKEYVDARLVDLQGQIDRRIQTQQRELRDAVAHLETLIREGDKQAAAQTKALEKAVEKAEGISAVRFEQANRFREQIGEERRTFVTRDVLDSRVRELERSHDANKDATAKQVETLKDTVIRRFGQEEGRERRAADYRADRQLGLAGRQVSVGMVAAAATALGVVFTLVIAAAAVTGLLAG